MGGRPAPHKPAAWQRDLQNQPAVTSGLHCVQYIYFRRSSGDKAACCLFTQGSNSSQNKASATYTCTVCESVRLLMKASVWLIQYVTLATLVLSSWAAEASFGLTCVCCSRGHRGLSHSSSSWEAHKLQHIHPQSSSSRRSFTTGRFYVPPTDWGLYSFKQSLLKNDALPLYSRSTFISIFPSSAILNSNLEANIRIFLVSQRLAICI